MIPFARSDDLTRARIIVQHVGRTALHVRFCDEYIVMGRSNGVI